MPPGKDKDIIHMTPVVQIPKEVGLAVLIVISITGNAMTVIAYLRVKQLSTVYDF
ncbi:hypothetical protein DPMN_115354 [Dreissena polymorpha]|uniref:Uncharacterized protein n=1 Tax=Dreissena polymorpha TaxID=45954 RepID=A0A9D4QSU6_DREPO|nr:hypothetical protein DPMN_115354 [Dreissena polymorpha]